MATITLLPIPRELVGVEAGVLDILHRMAAEAANTLQILDVHSAHRMRQAEEQLPPGSLALDLALRALEQSDQFRRDAHRQLTAGLQSFRNALYALPERP